MLFCSRNCHLSLFFQKIYCFLVFYTISLFFVTVPLLCLIVYRAFLSIAIRLFSRGRYTLIHYSHAIFPAGSYANQFTISFFLHIKGSCDIHQLRNRMKDINGSSHYGTFLKGVVEKWGYFCWVDKSNSIDFTEHVRLCPGAGDENKTYTENEVFDAVSKLADKLWDQDKPRWELLITPKVKLEGGVGSIVAVRIDHCYLDGISFVQTLRNLICDQPSPELMVDPVNPPGPIVPWYKRLALYIQTFFMGPYVSLRLMNHSSDDLFYEGPLKGGKMFGRTKLDISLENMRRIRKTHNCTTQAIFHSAFTGALAKMAKKKGYPVPDEIVGAITHVRYPYPDEGLHNRSALYPYHPIKIGIVDPVKRLAEMNAAVNDLNQMEYARLWNYLIVRILGVLPACLIRATIGSFRSAYYISNVPGISGTVKLNGSDVERVVGIATLINGIRYSVGIGSYNDNFTAGFFIEKSKIIGCREELEEFIREFENEIGYL